MTLPLYRRTFAALATAALVGATAVGPAFAQSSVGVTINGQQVALNPAPTERAGRVFVPLRGVFEKLGASVVYANGQINATGNGRNITLHIGSTAASIDGQNQTIDVAPFIIGASTYVPLRFVAQALGANVNWDGANRVVAITTNGNGGPVSQTVTPQPTQTPQASGLRIENLEPGRNASTQSKRPTISATFSEPVDPNSVRITLDGREIPNNSYFASPTRIEFTPGYELPADRHTVQVSGKTAAGASFQRDWAFNSGTAAVTNFIRITSPANGAQVPNTFTVRGQTLPNSRVTVSAVAGTNVAVFAVTTGNFQGTTTADANGNFSQQVNVNAVPGGQIAVQVQSTEPTTRTAAPPQHIILRAQ